MNVYGKNSLNKLEKKGLDPTLKKFLLYAENKIENSTITDTVRTTEEQQICFKAGNSKLDGINKKSNHQLGIAFDIVPYPNMWNASQNEWIKLHTSIMIALHDFNREYGEKLILEWGGYWTNFVDKPHYEIKKITR